MGVQLREKQISGGRVSLYLDIYHNQTRWYETLNIHISKKRPNEDDKEKKRLANQIRSKRENELIVQDNDLVDRSRNKANFVVWFDNYMKERNLNYSHNKSTLKHLKNYMDGRPLPFKTITPEWIKGFIKYLLTLVSNNTAFDYIRNLFTALEEVMRQGIIPQNPFRKIPRHERMKRKPIFRSTFTLDDLQVLADTHCKMPWQFRQAFLFSCFCGLRWSDVNPLRWTEVIVKKIAGTEEWFIYFEQEKTEDIEYLPLADQAIEILKEQRENMENQEGEQSPFVFPGIQEEDVKRGKTGIRLNYYLKKWAKVAGIDPKRIHFHCARHTFATNILENSPDADLWTVSKLLGHKNISATQIYTHVRDSRKKSAVKGLPTLRQLATTKAA